MADVTNSRQNNKADRGRTRWFVFIWRKRVRKGLENRRYDTRSEWSDTTEAARKWWRVTRCGIWRFGISDPQISDLKAQRPKSPELKARKTSPRSSTKATVKAQSSRVKTQSTKHKAQSTMLKAQSTKIKKPN